MNRIRELHEKAMALAEKASVAKLKGDLEDVNKLFRQAFEKEAQAARLVPNEPSSEPTRSILYSSAASLAIDCHEFHEAERLIDAGFAGHPPEEIAEELRELADLTKRSVSSAVKEGNVSNNSYSQKYDDDIVLLAGAGASAYLGLPALDDLLKRAILGNDEVADRIRQTCNAIGACQNRYKTAVFEELIFHLRRYLDTAEMLRVDYNFRREFGQIPNDVDSGGFERKWKQALTECYRVLLQEYGPKKINHEGIEFQTTLKLLEELTKINSGKLHIYTTNYDCSYQVFASKCENVSFFTHINNQDGTFREYWYKVNPDLKDSNLPWIYVHRLHGCVAWFNDDRRPFRIKEIYGAGGNLNIRDDNYLHQMCIKLVVCQSVGMNPAFASAFEEIFEHLKNAKVLLVWGYSFRDLEVLRAINQVFPLRKTPLAIYYLDPFLDETAANENIQWTLGYITRPIAPEFKPKRIDWKPVDGHDKLVTTIIETLRKELNNAD